MSQPFFLVSFYTRCLQNFVAHTVLQPTCCFNRSIAKSPFATTHGHTDHSSLYIWVSIAQSRKACLPQIVAFDPITEAESFNRSIAKSPFATLLDFFQSIFQPFVSIAQSRKARLPHQFVQDF